MEFFTEIILGIFVEGSLGFIEEGKAPRGLRIVIAAILVLVYVGLFGGLMYGAITTGHPVPIVIMSLITAGATALVVVAIAKQFKDKRRRIKKGRDTK